MAVVGCACLGGRAFVFAWAGPTPTGINVRVFGADPVLTGKFRAAIVKIFTSKAGYELSDIPEMELILYVTKDFDSRTNNNGISVAAVHANNWLPLFLAKKFLLDHPTRDKDIQWATSKLMHENGTVIQMSVAHLDAPGDAQIQTVSARLAATFLGQTPPNQGRSR